MLALLIVAVLTVTTMRAAAVMMLAVATLTDSGNDEDGSFDGVDYSPMSSALREVRQEPSASGRVTAG